MAILTIARKASRPAGAAEANTFGLPRGETLRRQVKRVFRDQHGAILKFLRTGRKQDGPVLPFAWPDWNDFQLGALAVSRRMTPVLTLTWEAAAAKFAPKVGLDPNAWEVVNPHTERMIDEAALAFCQSMNATTSLQLDDALEKTREALKAGVVEQGESVEVLTKRVNAIFDGAEKWRARRIAQTETSRAVHAAQEEAAKASGVVTGWTWLLSSDACPLCNTIARRAPAVRLGHAFAVIGESAHYSQVKHPPAHPHCCLPETPVIAPVGIAGMKAQYDGPVVRLRLSDGSDITVTPHHMLLTTEGFAFAGSLVQGDDVLRYRVGEPVTSDDPDDDRVPTPIGQVFDAWAESVRVAAGSVPASPEYLHGDATFCQGEIRVVTPNRLLWHNLCAESAQPFAEHSLRWPHLDRAYLTRTGDLAKMLFALRDATDGGMGSRREFKAGLRAQSPHPDDRRRGRVADCDSGLDEAPTDCRTRDAESLRKGELRFPGPVQINEAREVNPESPPPCGLVAIPGLEAQGLEPGLYRMAADSERIAQAVGRFPGKVTTAKIVSVDRLHYAGPVFDITTGTSLYLIGNGIVSSNCNCTLLEVLDTDEQPKWADTLHQPKPEPEDLTGPTTVPTLPQPAPIARPGKPARKPKPTPAAPVKPKPVGPAGTPVSDALDLAPAGKIKPAVQGALAAIDQVHGDGALPTIPVKATKTGTRLGAFWKDVIADKPLRIEVSVHGDHPRMTAVHEAGHFLENSGIPKTHVGYNGARFRDFRKEPQFAAWAKAIDESEAVKTLRAVMKRPHVVLETFVENGVTKERRYNIDKKHAKYLASDEELWARSYAQYIAHRSEDKEMARELETQRATTYTRVYGDQWSDEDFRPVAAAFDDLFKHLGWRK